jgi:hypothetical protein
MISFTLRLPLPVRKESSVLVLESEVWGFEVILHNKFSEKDI